MAMASTANIWTERTYIGNICKTRQLVLGETCYFRFHLDVGHQKQVTRIETRVDYVTRKRTYTY